MSYYNVYTCIKVYTTYKVYSQINRTFTYILGITRFVFIEDVL